MPKTKISEFSATPANNTDIDSINIAEGCAPSGINDAIRELMAQLKDFQTGAAGDSFGGPVNGALNGTIGATTPNTGAFTTLSVAGSTSGTTTIKATAVAGTTILTLPAVTGTLLSNVTQLVGNGTTTNDSASAGVVGQYVSSTVGSGSLIALTSGTATNITTISLTAGDWDVAGIVGFGGISGTSVVAFVGANAGTTSAGISPAIGIQVLMNGSTQISTVADMTAALPVYRYSLASTTTIYLVARASYTSGSIGAYGTISARRVR